MLLHVLLTIYVSLMIMDFLFMLSLHFLHDRKGYYKTAAIVWAGLLTTYLCDGLVSANFNNLHHLFGIAFANINMHYLAKLAADIYKFRFPRRKFIKFSAATWLTGALITFAAPQSFVIPALVICIGIVAPVVYASHIVLRKMKNLTIIDRFFGFLMVAEAIHVLDYPFIRNNPTLAVFGFSFGMILVYFASMLLPVVINRRLSAEFSDILQKEVDAKTKSLAESLKNLQAAQAKLVNASKFAALGEMAGGMAHEINTPLAIIKMRANQITRNVAQVDPEVVKNMATVVESTADRIDRIIQGLRSFARNSDADPMTQERLPGIIEDALDLCRQRMMNKQIALHIEPVPDLGIKCRPTQITQVLINILNNAHDAVEDLPVKWVKIDCTEMNQCVEIRIIDSGHRIANEVEKRLFQPFFTTKPIGKGTGLGLSISKGIVEAHGGQIYYDPNARNTCFVIILPVTPAEGLYKNSYPSHQKIKEEKSYG